MIFLTFLAAFLLSGIAAYYSVIGLTSIFVGAFWPVVMMGSSLEFAKLVTASWLYRNWKSSHILLKTYLTIAVLLLMLITSMGIFGFLAKSHIDSTLNAGENTVELKSLNEQENNVKEKLDYLLARAKDPSTASNKLDKQIQDTQKQLSQINTQRLPLLKESNKLTADIGPIKYVADMLYGDDENGVDKAVRLVIMIIMLVFDPLAVLLLIAGNISLEKKDDVNTEVDNPEQNQQDDNSSTVQKDESIKTDQVSGNIQEQTAINVEKENIVTMYDEERPYSFSKREKL